VADGIVTDWDLHQRSLRDQCLEAGSAYVAGGASAIGARGSGPLDSGSRCSRELGVGEVGVGEVGVGKNCVSQVGPDQTLACERGPREVGVRTNEIAADQLPLHWEATSRSSRPVGRPHVIACTGCTGGTRWQPSTSGSHSNSFREGRSA